MRRKPLHTLYMGNTYKLLSLCSLLKLQEVLWPLKSHTSNDTKSIVKPRQNVSHIRSNLLQNLAKIFSQNLLQNVSNFMLSQCFTEFSQILIVKHRIILSSPCVTWSDRLQSMTFVINHRYSSPLAFWPALFQDLWRVNK